MKSRKSGKINYKAQIPIIRNISQDMPGEEVLCFASSVYDNIQIIMWFVMMKKCAKQSSLRTRKPVEKQHSRNIQISIFIDYYSISIVSIYSIVSPTLYF